jgi:hypothetical protein
MSLTDGENILVADSAEAFADAVARLYMDETLWLNLSQAGIEFAKEAWGAEAAWGILANILRELNFNPTRKNRQLSLYSSSYESTSRNKKTPKKPTAEPDDYRKKIQQELSIYEKQVNVHDLPDITAVRLN